MARRTAKVLGGETHGGGVRAVAEAFQEREAFYRSILDSLAEGVLITDRESRILYANRSLEELTGHSRDDLTGKVSYEVLSPRQNWPVMRRRLRQRLSGKSENL
jgi:PAS domain S-box-containing protein